ncbi:hypothetical protein [Fodinicola feengrottensis]|uniref:hypothetical protein n=1 Tax=Fodinicola feengrottensis TaxID=435914 RepID=UPI0013D40692|nr:hypothetical protein [Fodinicola feengrottensis]
MTSGPSGSRYGGRRQGNGHKSMVVRALERGNVTEPKYQKQFVEEAKNAGLSTAIFTPVNVVAGTLTSIGVWIALNPQTFDEKLIDAAISATPGVVVGSAVGVAQTLFSKYREVRKASKQAVKDRAEGKDPDTEPLDKFKQHDDAIAAQARKHRGLLGVTSRAIRALSQRLTGTNQRVDALQAQSRRSWRPYGRNLRVSWLLSGSILRGGWRSRIIRFRHGSRLGSGGCVVSLMRIPVVCGVGLIERMSGWIGMIRGLDWRSLGTTRMLRGLISWSSGLVSSHRPCCRRRMWRVVRICLITPGGAATSSALFRPR